MVAFFIINVTQPRSPFQISFLKVTQYKILSNEVKISLVKFLIFSLHYPTFEDQVNFRQK